VILPPAEQLDRAVQERVTKQRYLHSVGVRDTAVLLAERYGCDTAKAACAALLHDVARDLPLETMQSIVTMQRIVKTNPDVVKFSGSDPENRICTDDRPGGPASDPPGNREGCPIDDNVFHSRGLLHARAGRVIACSDFGIEDENVLRSIELHTTGAAKMTVLDKVVFVADYIEPNRHFPGLRTARKIARRNLDEAVLHIFREVLRTLVNKNAYICRNTILGYNELVRCREALSL